jgi:hypothetical protein
MPTVFGSPGMLYAVLWIKKPSMTAEGVRNSHKYTSLILGSTLQGRRKDQPILRSPQEETLISACRASLGSETYLSTTQFPKFNFFQVGKASLSLYRSNHIPARRYYCLPCWREEWTLPSTVSCEYRRRASAQIPSLPCCTFLFYVSSTNPNPSQARRATI